MPINSRMDKHSLVYAYNKILYFNENELYTASHNNVAESHKQSKLKKTNKRVQVYESI